MKNDDTKRTTKASNIVSLCCNSVYRHTAHVPGKMKTKELAEKKMGKKISHFSLRLNVVFTTHLNVVFTTHCFAVLRDCVQAQRVRIGK